MNLKKLYLTNFYAYQEEKIEFNNNGIYIIYGVNKQTQSRNGIGKSAIFEAIQFALFGKLRVDSIDDAVRFGTTKMEVELVFTIGDIDYSIVRGREKNKKTYVDVYINGKTDNKPTISDNNVYIASIIGLTHEQFTHSFFYGQGEYDNLQVFTSKKLIDFLKTILQLDRFDKYRDMVKEKVSVREDKLNHLLGVKETIGQLQTVNKSKKELVTTLKKVQVQIDEVAKKSVLVNRELERRVLGLSKSKSDLRIVDGAISNLLKELAYVGKNMKCPTCKQTLKDSKVEKALNDSIDKLKRGKFDITKNISKWQGEVEVYQQGRDAIVKKAGIVNNEKLDMSYQLDTLNKTSGLNKEDIEKKYKKLLNEKAILEEVTNVFNSKGLPLYILNTYVPKLECVINEVLSRLTNFKIRIITQEKLKSTDKLVNVCKIKIVRGANVYSLGNLSKGEERLINLAFRIGIAKIFLGKCQFETLMLDEVFSSLGAINRDKVIDLVRYLKKIFKKVLVISHIDDVRDCFTQENQIEIIKSKGISTIKKEKTTI